MTYLAEIDEQLEYRLADVSTRHDDAFAKKNGWTDAGSFKIGRLTRFGPQIEEPPNQPGCRLLVNRRYYHSGERGSRYAPSRLFPICVVGTTDYPQMLRDYAETVGLHLSEQGSLGVVALTRSPEVEVKWGWLWLIPPTPWQRLKLLLAHARWTMVARLGWWLYRTGLRLQPGLRKI